MDISNRERLKAIAHFQRPNDVFLMTFFNTFWDETVPGWIKSGAPAELNDSNFRSKYFGFVYTRILHEIMSGMIWVSYDVHGTEFSGIIPPISPQYEVKTVSEDERTLTIINKGGQTAKIFKDHPQRMPEYLAQPVKDWDSWKDYKKRLSPDAPGRFPTNWVEYAKRINAKDDTPVCLQAGSFFGFLREWMGLEKLLYTFHDFPDLIEDMMDTILELELAIINKTVKDIKIDWVLIWEDMCYKTGPFISPDMFKKYMMPRYRKITDLLHKHGIDTIFVDCDGNITKLIPLWLECGVNGMWPLEVTAGMDAVALRKQYGKDVMLGGGIDKRTLFKDKNAIKAEVMAKVPFLLSQGGYFPSLDHAVPPDVPLENFQYYINLLRELGGQEKLKY